MSSHPSAGGESFDKFAERNKGKSLDFSGSAGEGGGKGEAVNARQILIQEARKHGRAYWSNRKSASGYPWPLIYQERRYACLRALMFLKAASTSAPLPVGSLDALREAAKAVVSVLPPNTPNSMISRTNKDRFEVSYSALIALESALLERSSVSAPREPYRYPGPTIQPITLELAAHERAIIPEPGAAGQGGRVMDQDTWDGDESGPFCRHWGDPSDCEEICECGHICTRHDFASPGECNECDCKEWRARAEGQGDPL